MNNNELYSLCTYAYVNFIIETEKYNSSLKTEITRKFPSQSPVIVKYQERFKRLQKPVERRDVCIVRFVHSERREEAQK